MSAVYGDNLKLTLFGESHSKGIGAVIDGLPSGIELNEADIKAAMARRSPSSKSVASTLRREKDKYEIFSGFFSNHTTGTPLSFIIRNSDTMSSDYERISNILRPGHADFSGDARYNGYNDRRGGGHFSGRLTAPIVFAGSIARQYLASKNIFVGAHIKSIADIQDGDFTEFSKDAFSEIEQKDFGVIDDDKGLEMLEHINEVRLEQDSCGGTIKCVIIGVPAGIGEPFFSSIESKLSQMMFSIPAIKGIEFGCGFKFGGLRGSEANDLPILEHGRVKFASNNNGGINGGISNGMPIEFKVVVKPTPSISKSQMTVDILGKTITELQIKGRHDVCIVPRALEVVKSAAAFVIMDMYMGSKYHNRKPEDIQ